MSRPEPRSLLFVPGHRADRFDKACACGADAVIVDLEDAVPMRHKAAARAALADWLSVAQPVFVRINTADTPGFEDDLQLCGHPGVAGVVVPKAEDPRALVAIAHRLGPSARLLALIETARGLADARSIAGVPQVSRLVFGNIDFRVDLRLDVSGEPEGDELLYARSRLVLMSRVAGIAAPVDGVTLHTSDGGRVREDATRSRRLGFGGKLCIHPSQVAAVNEAFEPGERELAWARRVLAVTEDAHDGVVAVDGVMVDRPVIAHARSLLAWRGRD